MSIQVINVRHQLIGKVKESPRGDEVSEIDVETPWDSTTIVIVPGWRDSGPGHWQTLWTAQLPHVRRVVQDNWISPLKQAWVERLSETILDCQGPVVIAAHSLGCMATVHLPNEVATRIQAALLVAPADPERRCVLSDFAPVPYRELPYRSIVVGSSNDPYCPARLSSSYAKSWGSAYVRLKDAGHINVQSGHGDWPLGLALLGHLVEQSSAPSRTPASLTFTNSVESVVC